VTENERIKALRAMLERNPNDARVHFGLAAEYEKLELGDAVVEELQQYLAMTDDQGNAWGRLGNALRKAGRDDEARAAFEKGVQAARAHGHPSMAAEFEETLAGMNPEA
jgi:tetratricopeptide (TPR) repeat protein